VGIDLNLELNVVLLQALCNDEQLRYPISSFLFWQVPVEARDNVETYELLHKSRNHGKGTVGACRR
jgi:hypothetical protein